MKLLNRFWTAASAGLVVTSWLVSGGPSGAADLNWKADAGAAPVSYQEPIGGRIDESGSDVVPASATEYQGGSQPGRTGPGEWSPQRTRPMSARNAQQPVRQPVHTAAMERSTPGSRMPANQMRGSNSDLRMAARGRIVDSNVMFAPDGPMPEAIDSGEIISDGGEIIEGMPGEVIDGEMMGDEFGDGSCGSSCNSCGERGCCWLGGCDKCPPGCIPAPEWPRNIDILGGVQGFKGPLDQGRNGNFGFHEGFNIGGPLWLARCVSYQFGGTWVQSNFNGDQSTGEFREDARHQVFATAGFFIRADDCLPWQGGVVIDWLNDDYGVEYNVAQVRAEISRVGCFGNEFGFMGTFNATEDEVNFGINNRVGALNELQTLRTVDQYALFLRRHFDNCGEGRIWGGATGDGDGLVGADYRIPLSDSFLIQGNFNYLIASDGDQIGQQDDSWGISLELVFQPFCRARRSMNDHSRPLFNVADNSRLFVKPK